MRNILIPGICEDNLRSSKAKIIKLLSYYNIQEIKLRKIKINIIIFH